MRRMLSSLLGAVLAVAGVTVVGSVAAPVASAAGEAVVPVVPARLLDTRPDGDTDDDQAEGIGFVIAGGEVPLQVTGRHGIPGDATAVVLNVTAVGPDAPGFLTVYPCGETRPGTSSVNYSAGQIVPNAVLAKIGTGGRVCVYTLAGAHILADVTGYVPAGGGLSTLNPGRLLDTRPDGDTDDDQAEGIGFVIAGGEVPLQVTGRHGIPGDAAAVMLNVTAVTPDGPGFLTVYPCGSARPTTSSVNYSAGQIVPNAVLVKVGAGGRVCVYTLAGAHILADVTGYVPAGSGVSTLNPGRLLDTRPDGDTDDDQAQGQGFVDAGGEVQLQVGGRLGIADNASAVILNVTAVGPDGPGFLTVYPCGSARPGTSSVNYSAGQIVPNAVLVKVGAGGQVCVYTLAGAHILADVTGYVAAATGGGGGGGTGGGGGGGGTGGGGGGGGTDPGGGAATWLTHVGLNDQWLDTDQNGAFHLGFLDTFAGQLWYGKCTADCYAESSWHLAAILDSADLGGYILSLIGIGVDDAGRVHGVLRGWASSGPDKNWYVQCASNCNNGGTWGILELTAIGAADAADDTLDVTPAGQVSFFTTAGDYSVCSGSCLSAASWGNNWVLQQRDGNDTDDFIIDAEVDADGITHVLMNDGATGEGDSILMWAGCEADCTDDANWVQSQVFTGDANTNGQIDADEVTAGGVLSAGNVNWGSQLAVDSTGRVYMVYPQGELNGAPSDPANNGIVVRSCTIDPEFTCGLVDAWDTFYFAKPADTDQCSATCNDPEGSIGLAVHGTALGLVTSRGIDDDQQVLRHCTSDCHLPDSWDDGVEIDNASDFSASVPMESDSTCGHWYEPGGAGVDIAVSDLGYVVVHSDNILCGTAPIGRAISNF